MQISNQTTIFINDPQTSGSGGSIPSSQVVANETSNQPAFASSVQIQLSPEAQRYLAGSAAPQSQTMSLTSGSGSENPDGTTTTVGDVVVIGQKRTLFTVEIQLPAPPEWVPDVAEIGAEPPGEVPPVELTPCQKETLKDRAALEAKKIIDGLDKKIEWGMYLVRDADGSIRGVGPVQGENGGGNSTLDWSVSKTALGISSWSQLVGLVHSHPVDIGGDPLAYQFSEADENTTEAFLEAGADPSFRQYISIGDVLKQFGKHADEGDVSNDTVTGEGCA